MKKGVLLVNLGTPDNPNYGGVFRYLNRQDKTMLIVQTIFDKHQDEFLPLNTVIEN